MSRLSRSCCAAVRRKVAAGTTMAALAREAGVPYRLVRRVYHANSRRDSLGGADADEVITLLRACGYQFVLTSPHMPPIPVLPTLGV